MRFWGKILRKEKRKNSVFVVRMSAAITNMSKSIELFQFLFDIATKPSDPETTVLVLFFHHHARI